MPRFFKLRVPGDTVTDFSPNPALNYKLSTSGYSTFSNPTTVTNSELIFLGSKADLRRLDALDSNVAKLFVMLRSTSANDTDSLYNNLTAFRARALETARTLNLGGGDAAAGATVSFDGSANVTLSLTLSNTGVSAGTYNKVSVDAKGRVLQGLTLTAADINDALGYTPAPSGNGTTASFADALTNARNFSISGGDAAAGLTTSFNGTANAVLSMTLSNTGVTAGTYNRVVVDAKGRVTSASNLGYLTAETDTLATVTGRGATTSTAISITANTASTNTTSGALTVTGGVGIGGALNVGGTFTAGNSTLATTTVSALTVQNNATVSGALTVTGDLTVNGTTTSVNSTNLTLVDPILELSSNATNTVDARDRGLSFRYGTGSAVATAFFGWRQSSNRFVFVPTASITSEVVSGAVGTIEASLFGNASTATTLATSRNFSISGGDAAAGSTVGFNGSANAALSLTLSNTGVVVGTYLKVSVDAKGRVLTGLPMLASDVTTSLGYTPISNAGGTFTGNVNITGTLTVSDTASAADPTADGHLTTRRFVEARSPKQSVRVATTSNTTAVSLNTSEQTITNNGTNAQLTIDGVALSVGDRILLKNRVANNPSRNGIFVVTVAGDASTPWVITRASDGNTWDSLVGAMVTVTEGTQNAGTVWMSTSAAGGVLWTTPIEWQLVSNPLVASVGGLSVNGFMARTDSTTATARTITGNTDIVVVNGDGVSGNPTITLSTTGVAAGTYTQVVVNAQGRVTAGQAAAFLTGNQTITLSGDATGSGTTAIAVTLANTGVAVGTYTKVGVDAKGRVLTGLQLNAADVTNALGYTPPSAVNGTFTGNVTIGGNLSVTGTASAADPTADSHLVTRQFLERKAPKDSVRVASTANVNIASPGASMDGVTLATGNRVLLKNQSTASQNGIYVWTGSAAALTRASDMDQWADVPAAIVGVEEGTTNANTIWFCTNTQTGTLGTTAITWQLVSNPLLASIGGVTSAADRIIYQTGPTASAVTTLTSFARTLIDDVDQSTARTTLGVGTGDSPTFAGVITTGTMNVGSTLTVAAGTTTIPAMRLTSGVVLTAASAGAVEWNGTNLFLTQTGNTRRQVAYITDNVATATSLQTPRAFSISGVDAAAGTTVNFDGTGAVVLPMTLSNTGVTAGTYNTVVVDAKGRVTAASNTALTAETDTLQTVTTRGATTSTTTISFTANTASSNTTTGTVVVTGGVGIGGNLNVGGNGSFDGNLTVGGNLVVNGTTHTVNSTTVTFDDVVLTIGGDTAPTVDDNTDRGIEFRWHNGSTAQLGFFGFRDSTSRFVFIPSATNTSGVYSGTIGTIEANIVGAVTGNASTATTLATSRNFSISGGDAAAGTAVGFNGSANAALTLTLSNTGVTAGTYNTVVVDAKGRVTSASNSAFLTGNQNITLSGDATGSGTTTIPVTLASTGVAAGTYTRVAVDAKGRVTSASNVQLLQSDVAVVTNAGTTTYSFLRNSNTMTLNGVFLLVYLNRVLLRPSEYSVSGNNVTFSVPLSVDDEIEAVTLG